MSYVLDSGALIGLERGDESMRTVVSTAVNQRRPLRTSCAVVAQVWRGGGRQARLARRLPGIEVVALDERFDRRIGELLRQAGTSDVVDGHVALLTRAGDYVVTSDPDDIGHLLDVRDVRANVLKV